MKKYIEKIIVFSPELGKVWKVIADKEHKIQELEKENSRIKIDIEELQSVTPFIKAILEYLDVDYYWTDIDDPLPSRPRTIRVLKLKKINLTRK